MKRPYVEAKSNISGWQNWHRTIGIGGHVGRLLKPFNRNEDGSGDAEKPFLPGLEGLCAIVEEAATANDNQGVPLRAYGSRWSLNDIAYTYSWLVDSNELNYCQVGIEPSRFVTPAYQQRRKQLVFVQCGVGVKTLNAALEKKGLPCLHPGQATDRRS